MNDRQIYWFLTFFKHLQQEEDGEITIGRRKCLGFFTSQEEALAIFSREDLNDLLYNDYNIPEQFRGLVEENEHDQEDPYQYAVIEGSYDGLDKYNNERLFFVYSENSQNWINISEPEILEQVAGFAF